MQSSTSLVINILLHFILLEKFIYFVSWKGEINNKNNDHNNRSIYTHILERESILERITIPYTYADVIELKTSFN